ncbi:MAG: penicillin-binding protein 1C [Thermoanaerobaculia bacterium]|nr:penicillin-binding protein 1C [Thermoanaerobaculia bacterium]
MARLKTRVTTRGIRRLATRLWNPRRLKVLVGVTGGLVLGGLGALYLLPLPDRLTTPPSTFVTYSDGSPAHVFLSPDDKYRIEVDPSEVDPRYLDALLRFEDKRFFYHPGVDPIAIVRSAALNVRHGRVLSGASTLTMQLVRLLEPRPRTLSSKVVEAVRALQIELRLSKNEVLTAYLSFLPFGGNLEGVEAASHAYFGHSARQLDLEEIALLLAVPQRPARRFPSPDNRERLTEARNEIAAWLIEEGLDLGQAREDDRRDQGSAGGSAGASLETAVPTQRRPMPRDAPYFAYWLRDQHPGVTRLETTLDRGLQRVAEETLAAERDRFAQLGIDNGALVLTDHTRGELVAVVGGFDYWSPTPGAQIPAFSVPRSPGSALKPLIYALAIDAGLALPERVVADIPLHYGGYAPGNYDGQFAGLVSLESALSRSLNIPFVRLLSDVGVERFLATLRRTGLTHLDPQPGHYGLSAAIGSLEISPLELAGVYAMLGNEGTLIPLHWLRESSPGASASARSPQTILSPGSAFLTARALGRRDRPDFPERRRFRGVSSGVRWKTGTSYGHRDAWAAGFDDRYAAAVWLGNLDNRSSVDLVGADAAGPLLFDLLESTHSERNGASTRSTPPDLQWVTLCADTGYLPSNACERRTEALALRRHVPTDRCPYHRLIDVDRTTGFALAPGCRSGREWDTRSFVVWPASLRRWLGGKHRTLPSAPTLDPSCRASQETTPPAILSPPHGQVLVLMPGMATDRQEIPFQAEVHGPPGTLSWFVDGEYVGAVHSDEALWWSPAAGKHRIVVVDTGGGSDSRDFEVRQRL